MAARWIPNRCYDDGPCDEYEGPEEEELDAIAALTEIWTGPYDHSTTAIHAIAVAEELPSTATILSNHHRALSLHVALSIFRTCPTHSARADLVASLETMPSAWRNSPLCQNAWVALL